MEPKAYTVLQRWMATELGLSGNDLIIYAAIYGYTVNGEGYFGGLSELGTFAGITERGTIKVVNRLVGKGLVERRKTDRKTATYRTTMGEQRSCQDEHCSCRGEQRSFSGEHRSPLIDNIDNININNTNADFESEFAELWKLYPRKEGKANALKAYVKARRRGASYQAVLDGIKAYVRRIAREQTDMRYVKHGGTWFSQQCWEDDYQRTSTPIPVTRSSEDEELMRILRERQQAKRNREGGGVCDE